MRICWKSLIATFKINNKRIDTAVILHLTLLSLITKYRVSVGGYLSRQVVFRYDTYFPVEGSDKSEDLT